MPQFLKKFLPYLVPVGVAAAFCFYFGKPVFSKASTSPAVTVANRVVASTREVPFDIKKIPEGQYYNFIADYSCVKPGTKKSIPSYFDSFKIAGGKICHLGDVCSTTQEDCSTALPKGMVLAKDFENIKFEKKTYRKQASPVPSSCQMQACASPPDVCKFDELPPLDENGCPAGCGTIVCKTIQKQKCPILNCAALPQNCWYDGKAKQDENGCYMGCGQISCDTISTKEFRCPNINCSKPPENCHYDNSGKIDKNGCKSTCGQIVCNSHDPKKPICPEAPACSDPPAGCFYVGAAAVDAKGCRVGCGGIACKKNLPTGCSPPKCDPPSEFCRYDGNSALDFKGCQTGCGNLICN